ncbi:iron ABC transporter permease [Luteipulveratus mongoliensis]|uniref:Iron ABC transporter permease n=1 Tax=Luteipulveratus mongoliensis TaxID=571913 RepID=A0A0K1JPJ0_9MICO|nr:iron ABC transporter permease [Luteipulveratus mongoliensis]
MPGSLAIRVGGFGVRVSVRTLGVVLALLAIVALVAVVALGTGDYSLGPARVVHALLGSPDMPFDKVVVSQWRLPRVLGAVVIGAALGMSGAIFQSMTRNPLGSPDIIGFESGAVTGALVMIVIVGSASTQVAGAAIVGGFASAATVYVLAYRRGVQGFRLILTGIAIGAMLLSVNQWLVSVADPGAAMTANVWTVGTLTDIGWSKVDPVLLAVVGLSVVMVFLARPMHLLELGDDVARARGVRPDRTRIAMLVVGVLLTATATAAAGPISFVSLCAPQLARRVTGTPGVTVAASGAMGAALLLVSDTVSSRLLGGLPVGAITVCLGGTYFVWLLIREARR